MCSNHHHHQGTAGTDAMPGFFVEQNNFKGLAYYAIESKNSDSTIKQLQVSVVLFSLIVSLHPRCVILLLNDQAMNQFISKR